MRRTVLLLASMALAMLQVSGVVWADTFSVKNEKDSGPDSLRAAITSANAEPGRDVITFAPSVRSEINLKSQLPALRGELEIRGPGASKLTVRRNVAARFRVFAVARGSDVTISGLTISNGNPEAVRYSSYSGGIYNRAEGDLTLRGVVVSANKADYGGVYNEGRLTLRGSTISGNKATKLSALSHMEEAKGGGIYIDDSSTASFVLRGTIVARNEAPSGPDAFGAFSSGGYNLIGNPTGATGFGPTDLTNTRSGLDTRGPRDNGGPTKTFALVSGSPAIDAVRREACPPPSTDQRGVRRPQDGDDDGLARCDIGAYERRAPQ